MTNIAEIAPNWKDNSSQKDPCSTSIGERVIALSQKSPHRFFLMMSKQPKLLNEEHCHPQKSQARCAGWYDASQYENGKMSYEWGQLVKIGILVPKFMVGILPIKLWASKYVFQGWHSTSWKVKGKKLRSQDLQWVPIDSKGFLLQTSHHYCWY